MKLDKGRERGRDDIRSRIAPRALEIESDQRPHAAADTAAVLAATCDIAGRLTKDMRYAVRGKDGRVNGFDRPIQYPKAVFI